MNMYTKVGFGTLCIALAISFCILIQQLYPAAVNSAPLGVGEVIQVKDTLNGVPLSISLSDVSADGNIILFQANNSNLPDFNGINGLYVYNIKEQQVERVDISTSGVLPNGSIDNTSTPKLSESGRYATFKTMATNLLDGQYMYERGGLKRDIQNGVTTMTIGGVGLNSTSSDWSYTHAISNDGRYTLMSAKGDYPHSYGVYFRDGTDIYVAGGGAGNQYFDATSAGMSCDGAFVVYIQKYSLTLLDFRGGSTPIKKIIDTSGAGRHASPMMSCNGRYILYATSDRNYINPTPTGMDNNLHLVRYDRITGTARYIDSNTAGMFAPGATYNKFQTIEMQNALKASIADTGDAVFHYNGYSHLKRLSDGSNTLESVAKATDGSSINVTGAKITRSGNYIYFRADTNTLGMSSAPSGNQLIRVKVN